MEHLFQHKLLPAVTIESENDALEIAEVIQQAGLNVIEVPFRTEAAAKCIKAIKRQHKEFLVGAGTLLTPNQVKIAQHAGAQFGLAPGFNPKVARTALELDFPFIPGVTTSSEVEHALDLGFKILKFFPAEPMGGVKMLKSYNGPYAHIGVKFIPMGGISESNMKDYLTLENVVAVGGSWLCPSSLIREEKFSEVTKIVRASLQIAQTLGD